MTRSFSPSPAPRQARTYLKICGLTREEDVDAAVAAGADAVGFVLYERSPRHVTPERAAVLARRLPPFVTPVLLVVNATAECIAAACAGLPHCFIQFHGDETPAECLEAARRADRPFWRAARIPLGDQAEQPDLLEFAEQFGAASALLLDAAVRGYGGGGQSFDWSRLPAKIPAHLILSGGLHADNVADGIRALRGRGLSLGVDVSTGVEAEAADGTPIKGVKSAEKMRRFAAAVRAADATV